MNKKQIIKYGLCLLCILPFVALCIFGIVVLISRSSHVATKEVSSKRISSDCTEDTDKIGESDEILQILKNARIEEENMRLWEDVLYYGDYNETINMEHIKGTETTRLYKGPSDNENTVKYYFQKGRNSDGRYSFESATYFVEKQFALMDGKGFGAIYYDEVLKELDRRGTQSLGYITIEYPAPYFPVPRLTEKKQILIDKLQEDVRISIDNRRKLEIDYIEPGNYQVYILDFSETASGADIMMLSDKGMYCFTMMFDSDTETVTGPMAAHLYLKKDEDCDGIMFSELFIKLSVYDFSLVVNESSRGAK